ncbi:MAG TPA: methyltransferase domain-containing protein [Pseudolabrys sp.]|nr:methyltransferase domain-containing protein [Pseudolabrys sp.]
MTLIRRLCSGPAQRPSAQISMNFQINANLALELHPDLACQTPDPDKRTDRRVELAAQFIPAGARVFDLGEGTALQALLPNGCSYRGIDRPLAAFIRDLKAGDFPTRAATDCDVIVMLGVLERTTDVENLFTHLRFCRHDIVLSYCATDLTKGVDRAALGFANHLSFYELARLFDRYGFRIECTTPIDETQVLMRLKPSEWLSAPATSNVAVISADDAGDFGARLGRQMVNALLPGEAEVHHLNLRTLGEARANYDLVVLGTGGGLFPTLLGEEVLEIVSHAKAAIGIFGTHSRELISRPAFDRLIDRLDTWFARYEDDVLMYGRGRRNVVHIGDWLIDQFPLARAIHDEPLMISNDVGPEFALDRAIRTIQQHKQVYSTLPTALLCALTSAELAAYAELQRSVAGGQFRSMLIDIFGRAFPEQKFFMVDRDAVTRYKARVHCNVGKAGARIGAILRDVAVAA